jgi:hypothetical protein
LLRTRSIQGWSPSPPAPPPPFFDLSAIPVAKSNPDPQADLSPSPIYLSPPLSATHRSTPSFVSNRTINANDKSVLDLCSGRPKIFVECQPKICVECSQCVVVLQTRVLVADIVVVIVKVEA